ncbi:hypothetical protein Nepgr_012819 [Nepenthes gracilis]|uniref:Uncharacterized protein n=1 Tax=Nepenthes gracilis TaxID=150966 RepID=A0AAD3XNF4_NEPGR|nr:hypothetical protein Nepgr_012819 [Nepenthes gracilis]
MAALCWALCNCSSEEGFVTGGGMNTTTGSNACSSCGICQYPCHPQPLPASPYPPPPPPPSGYLYYGTPPPLPPTVAGSNCTPTAAGGGPYQYYSPPMPPYTYVPYSNYSAASALFARPLEASVFIFLLSFIFLFR